MAIVKWGPLSADMDEFLENLFEGHLKRCGECAVDIYEDEGNLVAEISMAGLDPKKTDVSVVDDVLKISGHREQKEEQKGKNYYAREIRRGSFERAIHLPVPVKADEAQATYKDGVLKVVMPKLKGAKHKKIEIVSKE